MPAHTHLHTNTWCHSWGVTACTLLTSKLVFSHYYKNMESWTPLASQGWLIYCGNRYSNVRTPRRPAGYCQILKPLLPGPGKTLPPFRQKIHYLAKKFRYRILGQSQGKKTRSVSNSYICENLLFYPVNIRKNIFPLLFRYFCENFKAVPLSTSTAKK